MQKSLLFVLFSVILISSCTTIEFEKPIPYKATSVNKCPTALIGEFVEQDADAKPHLLQEIITFESPKPHQLFISEYKFFTPQDLTRFPRYQVKGDTLIEHIRVEAEGSQVAHDSISKLAILKTKEGYQTVKKLSYGLDFTTHKLTNYLEESDADDEVGEFEMRKKDDTFYLNIKGLNAESDNWYVVLFKQTGNLMTVNFLSQVDEKMVDAVNKIMPLTKVKDNTYLAKPTETQLEAFLKYPDVGDVTVLKRLK